MARLYYSKLQAVLDADISAVATTITFTAPLREWGEDNIATIAAPDILAMWVGNELIHVTAYTSGASTATVLRGQEGSTATTHNEEDILRHDATATDWEAAGGGSGVVEAIVAGTGITVDDTDPANPIVASTADSSLDWVNVLDYGAVGDGTADDTAEIQAALDATPQGGVCYFPVPSVRYKITAALNVPHMMRICGGGSYLGRYTQIYQATANTSAFISSSTNGQHTVFEGLAIEGQTGGQTSGAAINTSQSVIVSRCLIYGFRDGLLVTVDNISTDQAYYCDVEHSLFGNATRAGIRLDGIVNNFTWMSCRADGNDVGVQVVGGPFGLRFYGGTFENNNIGLDIDGNDTTTGQDTAGVIVSGCYFEQADTKTDIRIGNGSEVRSVRIEGCPFIKSGLSGTGWHILATNVDGLTITDCEFTSSSAVSASGAATGVVYGRNHNMNAGTLTLPNGTIRLDVPATPLRLTQNAQTGTTYTLVLADEQKLVECANASPITLTVPPNSSVAFPVGTQVHVIQTGAGQVTVAPGSGVTINGTPGLKARAQWSALTLIKRATDTWVAIGDLAA